MRILSAPRAVATHTSFSTNHNGTHESSFVRKIESAESWEYTRPARRIGGLYRNWKYKGNRGWMGWSSENFLGRIWIELSLPSLRTFTSFFPVYILVYTAFTGYRRASFSLLSRIYILHFVTLEIYHFIFLSANKTYRLHSHSVTLSFHPIVA